MKWRSTLGQSQSDIDHNQNLIMVLFNPNPLFYPLKNDILLNFFFE